MYIMQQIANLTLNPVMIDSCALFFNCTLVCRVSDCVTVPM